MTMEEALAVFAVFSVVCVEVTPAATKDIPHVTMVTQVISGSEKPLCYDISGSGGDIFNLLDDPSTGLKVNIKLISERHAETSLPRVGELGIFTDDIEMYLETDRIQINGDSMEWKERSVSLGGEANGHIQLDRSGAALTIGRTRLNVVRNPLFMDVRIAIDEPFPKSAKGGIGDVSNRARISEDDKGVARLSVRDVDKMFTLELMSSPNCWHVAHRETKNYQDFGRIHQRNRVECIECIRTNC